jgi:hypothetical protein
MVRHQNSFLRSEVVPRFSGTASAGVPEPPPLVLERFETFYIDSWFFLLQILP